MGREMVWYGFRIDKRDYELIKKVAKERGMDLTDLLRKLIRKELAKL